MKKAQQQILVIFGASGDLAWRKLIPAIFDLFVQNLLPDKFAILGVGRSELTDDAFRQKQAEGIAQFAAFKHRPAEVIEEFKQLLNYYAFDTLNGAEYSGFKKKLLQLDQKADAGNNFVYYLATPPSMYDIIPKFLNQQDLHLETKGFKRLIVEKPFGYDLASAKRLNTALLQQFDEEQIYRIDHYLGKETVQNLLVTRFSNTIFEPLWNRNYIHHVEITSSEDIGVGSRGGYYDGSGALRDMIQNHLLLLVGLVAMEPPAVMGSNSLRNEIVKVFQSFRPIKQQDVEKYVIRGQYIDSMIRGKLQKGYRQETGVDKESRTETYVAMKFFIDNWRWADVPFFIRTGKMLPTRVTEIVIHFKQTPHHIFSANESVAGLYNKLVIRIQPDEGLLFKIGMKEPGAGFKIQEVNMNFHYNELKDIYLPSAYERLLLDCMLGDSTLYHRGDAVEAAWEFIDPILKAWKENPEIIVHGYPAGTWGPENADDLFDTLGITWRYPCKNLVDDGNYCEL